MSARTEPLRYTAVSAATAAAFLLAGAGPGGKAIAQTAEPPAYIHIRVDELPVLDADVHRVIAAGYAVVDAEPSAQIGAAVHEALEAQLEHGLRAAVGAIGFDGDRTDIETALATLGQHMDEAAGDLGLRLAAYGLSGLHPGPDMVERMAERLANEADRTRRRYEAEAARIAAQAAAEVGRMEAIAAADIDQIMAEATSEADRIMASVAGADLDLYTFWSSRLLAADLFADIVITADNAFAGTNALLADCLAPIAASPIPDGVAIPQAHRGQPVKGGTEPGPKQSGRNTNTSSLSFILTTMTGDGVPVDVPIAVTYLAQAGQIPVAPSDPAPTEALIRDVVAAELLPLLRDMDLIVAGQESPRLSNDLLTAAAAVLGDVGQDDAVLVTTQVGPIDISAQLAVTPFDPDDGGAMLAAAEADAESALEAAEITAAEQVDQARRAGDEVVRDAEMEARAFSAFLQRYQAAPELVARRFCLSLIAGEANE